MAFEIPIPATMRSSLVVLGALGKGIGSDARTVIRFLNQSGSPLRSRGFLTRLYSHHFVVIHAAAFAADDSLMSANSDLVSLFTKIAGPETTTVLPSIRAVNFVVPQSR